MGKRPFTPKNKVFAPIRAQIDPMSEYLYNWSTNTITFYNLHYRRDFSKECWNTFKLHYSR
jgi:hypothetical protein